jgi:hypothetical protein
MMLMTSRGALPSVATSILRRSLLDLAAMRSEDVEESCCSLRLFGDAAQLATPVLDHFGYRVGKTFTSTRHMLVNTLNGVWVIVTRDKDNRHSADLS